MEMYSLKGESLRGEDEFGGSFRQRSDLTASGRQSPKWGRSRVPFLSLNSNFPTMYRMSRIPLRPHHFSKETWDLCCHFV